MKLGILLIYFVLLISCNSEDKIKNTVEARLFLANNEWDTGSRDRLKFTDIDVTIKTPSGLYGFDSTTWLYEVEQRPGSDSISSDSYFEIRWYDISRGEHVKFFLLDNGEYKLTSKQWNWNSFSNVGKPITHLSAIELKERQEMYSAVVDAASAEVMSLGEQTNNTSPNNSGERIPVFQGTKVFCDNENQWYYVVTVDGDYIILSRFSGIYKKENSRENPEFVIAGKVIDNYRIITKGTEGNEQEVFTYTGSQLNELGYENSVSTYIICD